MSEAEAAAARDYVASTEPLKAVRQCLLRAPDGYSKSLAAWETSWASLTLSDPDDPAALARIYRFAEEHNGPAVWAEVAPWIPVVLISGAVALWAAWRGLWWGVRATIGEARRAWRG